MRTPTVDCGDGLERLLQLRMNGREFARLTERMRSSSINKL